MGANVKLGNSSSSSAMSSDGAGAVGPDRVLPADSHVTSDRLGSVRLRVGSAAGGMDAALPVSVPTLLRSVADRAPPGAAALAVKREGKVRGSKI